MGEPLLTGSLVETTRHGRVLVIRMDRPEKRNAINAAMTAALDAAFNEFEDDDELWVAILTGDQVAFSAGSDLAEAVGSSSERGGEYGVIRRAREKPLIAAVDGLAFGGGMELVLAADLVVAGADARFGLPEVARGVIATCGGLFRTARAIPLNVAREIVLTGIPISAARAYELGLVNRVTAAGEAVDGALELAEQICANSPVSVRESMRAMRATVEADDATGWQATAAALAAINEYADVDEGIAAFLEKRPPQWTGASKR